MNWPALTVFVALFILVTVLGFVAARWRSGDLTLLHEWGLGGRRFGTVVTWFLLGGDLYTAYTFVAVPALVYGAGALGFFAVPYTIMIYPLLYLIFPKVWELAHRKGYVTSSDIVEGQYGNKWLALAVGVTGIVATMPYIALQLVGMQVVIGAMGVTGDGIVGDLPLIIAFLILAAFTYTSGLRAPAMIAVVKDILIYVVVIAVTIWVPYKMGGFGPIFAAVPPAKLTLAAPAAATYGTYSVYATLALGSAFALFLYPHSLTAILSSQSPGAIRRNAALLPAYSLVLGLLALLGFMAVALKVNADPAFADGFKHYGNNFSVPALILSVFPGWFAGVAFAAIAIGALVPSAIMSIACANIVSRTFYKGLLAPHATDAQESSVAKLASLVVKLGALVFIIFVPVPYALQFQLLGGLWMIQILPSVILGLYLPFLNGWALLIGWLVGTGLGTWMASTTAFKAAVFTLSLGGISFPGYIALWSLLANIIVAVVLSLAFAPFERVKPRKA
ncbi:MAG TPA: sodium:solute symporter [Rhodopila sp.]|uniref:monocarboxylate uptake permease MctP n=1 Tax=Rhodopila sp. TaxID=2480087 RepID=UPI002CC0685C|nr:sodium:solute symporter [Rhodopila sp.]HVY18266.1 sodium:solute symporter [Rhodopila sp.]